MISVSDPLRRVLRAGSGRDLTSRIGSYIWQKGSLVGPSLKIPFFGPFLDAIYPDMNKYKAQWASGELSCVSVFHKYGVCPPRR